MAAASVDADFSLVEGLDAPLLAALIERRRSAGKPPIILAIAPTGRRTEALGPALGALLPGAEVLHFPAWETLPHERLSPSPEIVGTRIEVLRHIARWKGATPLVVTASVRGAIQPLAAGLTDVDPVELAVGGRGHDLGEVSARLVELAYHRVDMVSRRGEFALRGGILDVFPPTAPHPFRIEFFGDEVDQIRAFSVADQRSLPGDVPEVSLIASRELLLTDAVRERARVLRDEFPGVRGMLEKMAEGIPVEGMESLIPALAERLVTVVDYLPEGAAIALVDPERSVTRAITLGDTNREFLEAAWSAATAGAQTPIDLGAGDFLTLPRLREAAHERGDVWWTLSSFDSGQADAAAEGLMDIEAMLESAAVVRVPGVPVPAFQGNVDGATTHVGQLLADGWRVVVAASGMGLVERACNVLAERGIAARKVDTVTTAPEPGVAHVVRLGARARLRGRGGEARRAHRVRVLRAHDRRRPAGRQEARVAAAERRRSAAAEDRRLRRALDARHRPVRRAHAARGLQRRPQSGQERARVSRPRVRAVQARLPRRQALRADGSARPPLALRRRRGSRAVEDGRQRLVAGEGTRAQGRPRHRGRAGEALLGAHGGEGARVRAGHALAARARRGLPVRRDPRSAADDRRDQGRHGEADPDGSPALGRRRLRQDRGRRARRVQGDPGRQAGRDARADDAAGQAARRDVHRAVRRLPRPGAFALALPDRQAGDATRSPGSRTAPSTW